MGPMDLFEPCDRFVATDNHPVEANCVCCLRNYQNDVCQTLAGRFQQALRREVIVHAIPGRNEGEGRMT